MYHIPIRYYYKKDNNYTYLTLYVYVYMSIFNISLYILYVKALLTIVGDMNLT